MYIKDSGVILPTDLHPGNYTFRLRATSLAGEGAWTCPMQFYVPEMSEYSGCLKTTLYLSVKIILCLTMKITLYITMRKSLYWTTIKWNIKLTTSTGRKEWLMMMESLVGYFIFPPLSKIRMKYRRVKSTFINHVLSLRLKIPVYSFTYDTLFQNLHNVYVILLEI